MKLCNTRNWKSNIPPNIYLINMLTSTFGYRFKEIPNYSGMINCLLNQRTESTSRHTFMNGLKTKV